MGWDLGEGILKEVKFPTVTLMVYIEHFEVLNIIVVVLLFSWKRWKSV